MLKKYKFQILLLIILVANFFLISQVFTFDFGGDDFIGPTKFVLGHEDAQANRQFFLRPLGSIIAAFFGLFMNVYQAFFLHNLIFYLLTPYVLFYLARLFFKDDKTAFYASVFYACAFPYLKHTLNYMTDITTWFFLLLSIFLTLKYLNIHTSNPKQARLILWLNPVICFVGFLVKENGGLGMIFFVLVILFMTKSSFKQKIKKVILTCLIFLILICAFQVFITYRYDDNFLQFAKWSADNYFHRSNYSLLSIIKKIIAVFSIGWLYVIFGVCKIFKNKDKQKLLTLALLLPTSFSFLIWPYQTERLMYVAGPLIALLAAYGITLNKSGWQYRAVEIGLIVIFVVFSYSTDYLVANYNLPGF